MKSIFLLGFLLCFTGCDSVDAAFDCNDICTRYKDCFDSTYDVSACASRCRSHADDDTAYRTQADQCDACIDNRSCTSAVFNCAAECTSIVP